MELGEPWSIKLPHWPKAMWWDEAQQHFVALSEILEGKLWIQRLTPTDHIESLVPSAPIRTPLPRDFLQGLPLQIKFSLDHQWIAIQLTPHLIRIVAIGCIRDKQWTIDLSGSSGRNFGHGGGNNNSLADVAPMESLPTELPLRLKNAAGSDNGTPTTPSRGGKKSSKGVENGSILSMYFTDHGGTSQDFIVVTTHYVFCYKASMKRNDVLSTYAFPHTNPPCRFKTWWDDASRCLVVACGVPPPQKKRHLHTTASQSHGLDGAIMHHTIDSDDTNFTQETHPEIELQAYFFPATRNKQLYPNQLPPPDKLPSFSPKMGDLEKIYLVEVYQEPFLLELGDHSLNLYHLDLYGGEHVFASFDIPNEFPIMDPKRIYVCVLDDVICVSCRYRKETVMLDLQAGTCFMITKLPALAEQCPYGDGLQFYRPHYALAIETNGPMYPIVLNLEKLHEVLSSKMTMATFLLRRVACWETAHKLAYNEIECHMNGGDTTREDKMCRRVWMKDVMGIYPEEWLETDWKTSMKQLVIDCALLPQSLSPSSGMASRIFKHSIQLPEEEIEEPPKDFLTQTDILNQVLLVHAHRVLKVGGEESPDLVNTGTPEFHSAENSCSNAGNNGSKIQRLRVITDTAIDMIGAVTANQSEPCPALICFTAALLWRLDNIKELLAMLRAFVRCPAANNSSSYQRHGNAVLVEMLLAIFSHVERGCTTDVGTKKVPHGDKDDPDESIILKVIEIVSGIASHHTIARQYLKRGWVVDAMTVCMQGLSLQDQEAEQLQQSSKDGADDTVRSTEDHEDDYFLQNEDTPTIVKYDDPISGEEFFVAALEHAKNDLADVSSRCRLFVSLHGFLHLWDPDCYQTPKNTPASAAATASLLTVHQDSFPRAGGSALAHHLPKFPDDLFGGTQSPHCQRIRKMFGYARSDISFTPPSIR